MFLRKAVELFSRNRVLRRRLPAEFGSRRLYVSPDSALQYWKSDLSAIAPELFSLAGRLIQPKDVIWDVGANVGLFSFSAAARAGSLGKVLAIEPDPWLSTLLRRSAMTHVENAAPVEVFSVAVADVLGTAEFHIAKRGRSSNFVSGFGSTQTGGTRSSFPVMTVTLDWLAERWEKPVLIKIDVEGMEHLVLRGARNVLEAKPALIVEVTRGNAPEIIRTLTDRGYKLLDAESSRVVGASSVLPPNIVALAA